MNLENNFWKEYPELIILEHTSKFYNSDTTKGKTYSSKVMWGIFLINYPDSLFYNAPNKVELISKSHLKDEKFDWSKLQGVIDEFKNVALTTAERSLNNWNEIMTLRDNSLKELYKKATQEGDTDELVKLDKMLASTPKMFEDYNRVKETFDNEKLKKTSKGKTVSLADSKDI